MSYVRCLRGLGSGNTLVLLNGRRMVMHPTTQQEDAVPVQIVNVNTIAHVCEVG